MKFKKRNVTKKHFEINKFDGVGIELVLSQSRTPALEKKYIYYMGIELVLPQSRTRLMDYRTRYIHLYGMQIFVDCGTAGAEH